METRLDRLFTLLDTGSTAVIRKSAAVQLGEIHKLYPHKIRYLLNKILNLMRSKNWDTRIAAGNAVEAIANNCSSDLTKFDVDDESASSSCSDLFSQFDISAVLRDCASLLSADEEQFDAACVNLDDKEQILRQKNMLSRKLGLEGPAAPTDMELFDESDLQMVPSTKKSSPSSQQQIGDIIEKQLNTEGMSIREINVARRKARLEMKRQLSNSSGAGGSCEKKIKTKNVAVAQPGQPNKLLLDTVEDNAVDSEEYEWPFLEFCEILCNDLFSSCWETRHGAATLLREVIKHCGGSAGATTSNNTVKNNQRWLENMSIRLMCVLVLDRFGDYISDEVVAPVRETCAQALGTLCNYLPDSSVLAAVNKLGEVIAHPTWEVRYGVILGLKYVIAVKQDLAPQFGGIWQSLLSSINDNVDDVRSVTATCLLSVVDKLPLVIPQQLGTLMQSLWDALLDLDDLTSSTHSIMSFLSALLTVDRLHNLQGAVLVQLIPRVWPFLYHSINNVRKASLNMLKTVFTECVDLNWLTPILIPCLRHLYQCCLTERIGSIAELAESVWVSIVTHASADVLGHYAIPWFNTWLGLPMQSPYVPIDRNYILTAVHHKHQNESKLGSSVESELMHISGPIQDKPEVRCEKVMYTRLICTRCLGCLLARLPLHHPNFSSILANITTLLEFHIVAKNGTQRLCAALVVSHWIQLARDNSQNLVLENLKSLVLQSASEKLYFDELASLFTSLQTECKNFLASLKQQNVSLEHLYPPTSVFTIESAQQLATTQFESIKSKLKKTAQTRFSEHASSLLLTVNQLREDYSSLNMRVQLCLASALTSLQCLPPKLTPIIRPFMEVIKKEVYPFFQNMASSKLCTVLTLCTSRDVPPNDKVFRNLSSALCAFTKQTPLADGLSLSMDDSSNLTCDSQIGILTLFNELRLSDSKVGAKRGPKPKKTTTTAEVMSDSMPVNSAPSNHCAESIQYEGARNALWHIVYTLSDNLLHVIPTCTEYFLKPLLQPEAQSTPQLIINSLQVLQVIYDVLPNSLKQEVFESFPCLLACVKSEYTAVRHMAARTIAVCALSLTAEFMNLVLDCILPLLGATQQTTWRQGAIETVYRILSESFVTHCFH